MILDYSKQQDLININEFTDQLHVIGCGALGSWIAFYLLKMGFQNVHVYDYDVIEEHNLPNQMFKESDIGKPKVDAMAELYQTFFNEEETPRLRIHNKKVTQDDAHTLKGVVFCAVDDMDARKELFESGFLYNTNAKLWIEGRLSIWGAYVYAIDRYTDTDRYYKTFYSNGEAEVSACGVSQTALPSAVNCATIMMMQMIDWYNSNNKLTDNSIEYSIPWLVSLKEKWN